MIVVALDPGLANAGMAVVDSTALRCFAAKTVRTKSGESMRARLDDICDELDQYLNGWPEQVALLIIEDQHGAFFGAAERGETNASAAHVERVVGLAEGLAYARRIQPLVITPQTVRTRLGLPANCGKEFVARAVRMQIAGVPSGASNHAVDAVAIALAGARTWHGMTLGRSLAS